MRLEQLPWGNSKEWKKGVWYPGPVSGDIEYRASVEKPFESTCELIDSLSWTIYFLDPEYIHGHKFFGDIISLDIDVTAKQAVEIANAHNKETLWNMDFR